VPGGSPEVDGERDLDWELLPEVVLQAGEEGEAGTGFHLRWDEGQLYLLAEVADGTVDAGDRVELYVDDANAKAGPYQDGDAHYVVARDGTTEGGPVAAEVAETETGYRVEAALPLATAGELGRQVGFDIRVTDASERSSEASDAVGIPAGAGEQISWSDQNHEQDTDTSRWGTITLIDPVGHADIPRATTAPAVDGQIEAAWQDATTVPTDVLVEGSAEGATAAVRLLWDEQRLYVLAEVTDPQRNADNSNPWEQDSIEVFVDPGNTKSGAFKPEDGQYRINYQNAQSVSGDLDVIGENLTSAAEVVEGGYVIEASIELNTMTPEVGAFIGLEVQVNDATDGARTSVHTWHDPTGQSFQDTSRWGVARLVDAAEPPGPSCDETVDGVHLGPLTVSAGTLCLDGAKVLGSVTVRPGASLVATGSTVIGSVKTSGAETVLLSGNLFVGPVSVAGSTGQVELVGNKVLGIVKVVDNQTGQTPIVVSGNTVAGLLSCGGNEPAPVDSGVPNTVLGLKTGQCKLL
jgi:endo-1,4-beta-xylanase